MNDFYDNLNKVKRGVHLSADAKRAGREELMQFMRAHELVMKATPSRQRMVKGPFIFTTHIYAMQIGLAALLVMFLGGGTSLAAHNALPGDALYGVKLLVNEKVQSAVAVSTEAQANLDADLAAKRLEEGSQLAIQGRMDAETEAKVAANFEQHANKVEARIADLEAEGNEEAAAEVESRFESALDAHAKVLARLEANGETNVRPIREKVHSVLASIGGRGSGGAAIAAKVMAEDNEKTGASPAAEGRIAAATNVVASVNKFVSLKADHLSAAAKADAAGRLKNAETLIADANAKADAGLSAEALVKADQAFRIAHETKVLVQAQLRAEAEATAKSRETATLNFLAPDDDDHDAVGIAATSGAAAAATSSESEDSEGLEMNVDGNVNLRVR